MSLHPTTHPQGVPMPHLKKLSLATRSTASFCGGPLKSKGVCKSLSRNGFLSL